MIAADFRNFEAIQRLIYEFHADLDAKCNEGHTVFCYAIKGENKEVVDLFLEHARVQGGE